MRHGFVLLILVSGVSLLVAQEATPSAGEMWAVVIGIAEYQDSVFKPLPCALEDARGMHDFLLDPQGGGLKPEQVNYLPNAKSWQIDEAQSWLKQNVHSDDRVLFYYAGHAEQEEHSAEDKIVAYLVPSDGKAGHLYRSGIPLNKLKDDLWALRCHSVALVLDCCYSGTVVCSEKGGALRAGVVKPKRNIVLQRRNPPNRLVISSCGADQQAMELQEYKNGAFTFYFLQGLRGPADKNHDGRIDVQEAFEYLRGKVEGLAKKNRHTQTPLLEVDELTQPYYFKQRPVERPLTILLEKPEALQKCDFAQTVQTEVEIEGWVRYGAGVKKVQVGEHVARLGEMDPAQGVYFQLIVPIDLGKNSLRVAVTDKSGQNHCRDFTVERLTDPLVKLEIVPEQVQCKHGERVRFQLFGITQGGERKEIAVEWKAQYGQITASGWYTAPPKPKEDRISGKDKPLRKFEALARVIIVEEGIPPARQPVAQTLPEKPPLREPAGVAAQTPAEKTPTQESAVSPGSIPPGWSTATWRACWNTSSGGWVDFTGETWTRLPTAQQMALAQAYQEWYARWKKQSLEKAVSVGGTPLTLRFIPPGKFWMGSPAGDSDERPRHRVLISKPFYLGKYELTQAQWKSVMGADPSNFKGDRLPVDSVSWEQCQQFCQQTGLRLPTEAQWEYACRAGMGCANFWGEASPEPYSWYNQNSEKRTHLGGEKKPNAFGLYDMSGNVREWCADWKKEYPAEDQIDPGGPKDGAKRVVRGGFFLGKADALRCAARISYVPRERKHYIGCRVILLVVE